MVLCSIVGGTPIQWGGYSYYDPGVMFRVRHRSCLDTHEKAEIFLELALNTNQSIYSGYGITIWYYVPLLEGCPFHRAGIRPKTRQILP